MRMPEPVHEDDVLTFPIPGRDGETRDYTIQPCDIDTFRKVSKLGLTVVEVMAGRAGADDVAELLDSKDPDAVWGLVLGGDTFAAMRADGVSFNDMRNAFTATCLWYATGMDNDVAVAAWLGKAPTPASTPSGKAGDAESKTSSASTSTTSTRKKSTASRGRKSGRTTT